VTRPTRSSFIPASPPERAFLLTVGGESFDHADRLSEPIPVALDLIKAALSGVSLPATSSRSQNTPT
jgi:hypothetical protein